MQYKIPQNIGMADKIVGPLTLKQLIVLAIGGGFTYAIYTALAKVYLFEIWILPVVLSSLITVAVAFLKIRDIPFLKFLFLVLELFIKPRKRFYQKGMGEHLPLHKVSTTSKTKKLKKIENGTKNKKALTEEQLNKLNALSSIINQNNPNSNG